MALLASGTVYAAPVGVTATDQDSLQVDVNGNTKVNKGDTIRHTITIQSGGVDSTGMNFSETIDANTTLVPGSVVTTPVAQNHSYIAIGNVRIQVPAGFGLLPGSFGIPAPTAVVATGTSNNSGDYAVNADGSFTYNPPAGFEGTDTFTYTVDNGIGTQTGTVSITVGGMIWFVNNNAGACLSNCDGRLTNPFTSLAALNSVNDGVGAHPAANDTIFLYEGGTAYAGPIALLNGQKLFGQDSTSDLLTLTGLTLPSFSDPLPVFNSGNAIYVTITSAAGSDIILANGNMLRGFILGNAANAALSGSSFGTLALTEVAVNTTGAGLSLNTGTANATFASFSSSGGTSNITLTSVSGTTDLGSGSLSGATGTAVAITGGSGTISYSGSISKTSAGRLADIQTRAGGSIALSGNLTCNTSCTGINLSGNTAGTNTFSGSTKTLSTGTATAVTLNSNTGSTINFTNGGLSITTTSGTGFSATGGGTASVQGTGNVIASTTGTALNVQNTTIGAGGLNFRSISSNGSSATGIILDNTGAVGGLNISGTGSAGSGGTIANKTGVDGSTNTGIGIYLNNTSAVQLNWMQLNDFQNFGIRGNNVAGFTLANTVINGTNGNAASLAFPENYGEGSIYFGNATTTGLTGSAAITNCTISGGRARNVSVVNASGTLNRLTITGTTFGLNQNAADANQSLAVEARTGSNPVMNVTVTGSTFTGAPSDLANFTGQVNTTMDVIFQSNTLSNNHGWNIISGGGMTLATGGVMTLNVSGNTLRDADGSAITLQLAAPLGSEATSLDGTLNNNTIGVNAIANSGSKSGNGIFFSFADNVIAPKGQVTLAVTNNTIYQYAGNAAIYADNTGGNYNLDLTMTGNTASTPNTNVFAGLALTAGAPSTGDDIDVCANITGNNFSAGDPGNASDIMLGGGASGASSIRLPGLAPSSNPSQAQVEAFLLANNNTAGTAVATYVDPPATYSTLFLGGAACAAPTH